MKPLTNFYSMPNDRIGFNKIEPKDHCIDLIKTFNEYTDSFDRSYLFITVDQKARTVQFLTEIQEMFPIRSRQLATLAINTAIHLSKLEAKTEILKTLINIPKE